MRIKSTTNSETSAAQLTILLTGANGYIGRRLLPYLVDAGHRIICAVRDASRFHLPESMSKQVSIIEVDFTRPEAQQAIPESIDVAYYLIHSMSGSDKLFNKIEKRCATHFVSAMRGTRVKRVIYLSGIVNESRLSTHLNSRYRVEQILQQGSFVLTTLRAGIIIGSGSASFEIIRDLVEKLPFMIAPRWVNTRCQPIAIRNALEFLIGVLDRPETSHQSYDIGGPDVLTYKDMLEVFASVRGLKRIIQTVPVLSPSLSSYWLYFITSTSYALAKNLVNSMKVNVVCQANQLADDLSIQLIDYKQALELVFDKLDQNNVISSWKDALNTNLLRRGVSNYIEVPEYGCFRDYRAKPICNRQNTLNRVWQIGGDTGWYYANWLWKVRGVLDKLVGGVGLTRGRRNPLELQSGDTVDCWRVLYANKDEARLVLYAEMKLPGEAWLEFRIQDHQLHQRATFRPKGVWGRVYWWSVYPFHGFIFEGMLTRLVAD